ncbi:peptidylprolyl isomerase PrsA [Bacillus mangrovi]|uniref:Foldase protein PrsA n=1 Tax=Metabacillus mangrovi TaxID=1491830 RepID=A0A7X2S4Q8_9BACI|nr:peptidylprolyl isomerase [Metabacillus mangrovi]MTH53377.1 peptidylprolyl isomerase PrsA [Metabacillus mangrovi]
MKKMAIAAITATSLFALGACSNSGAGGSDVVAETKAGNITKDELYEAMKSRAGEQVLTELVHNKVLGEKYKVSKEEISKELESIKSQYGAEQIDMLIKEQGEEAVNNMVKTELLRKKAAETEAKVTDEDVKKYHESLKGKIKASHILVKDEKTANEVKKKLDGGAKFEDLAKEYSEDGSAQTGGSLGWFDNKQMVKEFTEAAFKLKKGEVSQPVKSEFGYHIIRADDTYRSYDEMKAELKKEVQQQKSQDPAAMQEAIDKALKDAKVEVKDKKLKDTFKAPEQPAMPEEQPAQ